VEPLSEYCKFIGLGDNLFLEDMSRTHRIEIIGGFLVAVRQGRFSRPRDAPLAESTVSDTLNHVAVVFRENGHDDPKQDAERNIAGLLRRQLRSYKKDDPNEVQQKALPVSSFDSSFPQNSQNFVKKGANSQELPTFGRCARASTQRFLKQSKGKRSNYASETSLSSETEKP
jgi:hypothetical protein